MSIEQLGIAKPDLRNPALAVMAETLTAAEHRYSGIPTMRNAMKEYGLPEPKFENRRNEFVVTLYNKAEEEKEAVNTEPIGDLLAFCHEPKTRQEIAAFLGVKTVFYAMQHYVQPLLAAEKLAMTIPEKPKSRNQSIIQFDRQTLMLSFLSPLSRCIRTKRRKNAPRRQAWCIVSTDGRFANKSSLKRQVSTSFFLPYGKSGNDLLTLTPK